VDLHWDAPGLLLLTSTNNIENLEWDFDISEFKKEIENINNNGYAITATGEYDEITSIATPIYGPYRKLLGALTLQAPSYRINPKLSEKMLIDLKQVSLKMSNEILLAEKF
jgi:DNA-binding IclR family transcriptional regulator